MKKQSSPVMRWHSTTSGVSRAARRPWRAGAGPAASRITTLEREAERARVDLGPVAARSRRRRSRRCRRSATAGADRPDAPAELGEASAGRPPAARASRRQVRRHRAEHRRCSAPFAFDSKACRDNATVARLLSVCDVSPRHPVVSDADATPRAPAARCTSSSARSSTTSGRRSPCCSSRASTCSAWRGCGSPRPPRSSPLWRRPWRAFRRARRATARRLLARLGRGARGDELLLLPGDRPAAARHRRRDRVPARDRRSPRSARARARNVARARARRARRLPAHRRAAGRRAARRRVRVRQRRPVRALHRARPPRRAARRRSAGIDGLAASMLDRRRRRHAARRAGRRCRRSATRSRCSRASASASARR